MPTGAARLSLLVTAAVLAAVMAGAPPAHAEPSDPGAAVVGEPIGLDVSWPQCDRVLPRATSFAVVGVNGGTAANTNPCLADQLRWAFAATGTVAEKARVQLYVNTANPGEVLAEYGVTTWPTDNVDPRGSDSFRPVDVSRHNPYGQCTTSADSYNGYTNDLACSWQYGWNRAVESVDDRFVPAARAAGVSDDVAAYTWWLDVETMNSWQRGGVRAHARNAAALEGMAEFYTTEGVTDVGLYSTHYQWRRIVGEAIGSQDPAGHTIAGNLINAPAWIAGSADPASAQRRCMTLTGLTGGPVVMNQYIADDLDHNLRCPEAE